MCRIVRASSAESFTFTAMCDITHMRRHSATNAAVSYPLLCVSNLRNKLGPYRDRKHVVTYEDALRKAGMPEWGRKVS